MARTESAFGGNEVATGRPIADYGFISDCHSAALVSHEGSVDWLCFPRFDSPSIFGQLVGLSAGHWSLRAGGATSLSRHYLSQTLVLETTFQTPTGRAVLTDGLAVGPNERDHDLGRGSPHLLLRTFACVEGEVELEMEYMPRPEYGLETPRLTRVPGGLSARWESGELLLSTPSPLDVEQSTAWLRRRVRRGERVSFALQYSDLPEQARIWKQPEIEARLDDSVEAWQSWAELHQSYEGPWADLVHVSGRVLQGLTYRPTGAIVAAPTTSLPEAVGGERNWDYRYAWLRDASFTMDALWVAACPHEAHEFFDWVAGAATSGLRRDGALQIMFGVAGEQDLTEQVLPHLSGWRNSRPVRIGNGAWSQRQLDVYGELLNASFRLADQLGQIKDDTRSFLVEVAEAAAERWQETDHGIWEVRSEPQHFLYSKLMCWVALDRAIRQAEQLRARERVPLWTRVRDEIRHAILTRGWSERANAFSQAFGSDALDASALMLALVGFLPASHPRMLATIRAVEENLTDGRGLVYRYLADDGLPGHEGTFLLCTFWLAEAQAMAGETERARLTFEGAVQYANDLGLLAEEVADSTGELLGNFPQAFSHIGLVNAAWAIAQAEGLVPHNNETQHVT